MVVSKMYAAELHRCAVALGWERARQRTAEGRGASAASTPGAGRRSMREFLARWRWRPAPTDYRQGCELAADGPTGATARVARTAL
jgi:hypothetical protein